ncbi:3-oxoacyl-ACP synthase III [Calycomorphotria hydatis]|uniref:3-oxoacyl-[acyl-carrier-protein] synthase 3 n=1 Tax=Calycomorphotria hydatis TaxID=2528027 RepID=A0A517TDL7_9PLAN|nr:3-oxoacyl-ACP synthase III [Calycomorphotria hydatis]QDT66462.1 3-oxoacyl-[acyl-carrier-protein] synthase 3 [Calycomorphotria hydatis]
MRYRRVYLESIVHTLPPHRVTSEELEARLAPVYDRLGLPEGRLELMTGIRERRFFDPGTLPGQISGETARRAIETSGIDPEKFGLLIHGSVCRDQMEPATACGVHHAAGLTHRAIPLDLSNACLGLTNGMVIAANQIESGVIDAAVVVGTETGRGLVEGTIDSLNNDETITRNDVKGAFASLTIGSGSAAVVLCHEDIAQSGHQFLGEAMRSATQHHNLCAGGVESEKHGDGRPRMETDSEALLYAGVDLAEETWNDFTRVMEWVEADVQKVVTHQVGRAHRKLLLDRLGIPLEKDFPTVETMGNTGAVALPMALSLAVENEHIQPGDHIAMLGIGSGLSAAMLGLRW